MRALSELAGDFAAAYPEQAKMLNLDEVKDRDPYVERLLEGVAFLTSRIRQRIDDAFPEITEPLLDQICPSLLRNYPSSCVVELQVGAQEQSVLTAQKGLEVKALNVGEDKADCKFTTPFSVPLVPLVVEHVMAHDKVQGGSKIAITLRKHTQAEWSSTGIDRLQLYIHADWSLAYVLHQLMVSPHTQIAVSQGNKAVRPAPKASTAYLGSEYGLLPSPPREHAAFSILHDYFCARERFLFVLLDSIHSGQLSDMESTVTIIFDSTVSLPIELPVTKDCIRVNCAPVVNVFSEEAQPIRVDHSKPQYRVRTQTDLSESSLVYSVESLSSRDQVTGETHQYDPHHAMQFANRERRTYLATTQPSGTGLPNIYLSVTSLPPFHPEVLSADILETNGQYPRRFIDIGMVNSCTSGLPQGTDVKNITRPRKAYTAPNKHDSHWQLISILNSNFSSLESANHLQHLLSMFDWTEQADNSNRIQSIETVRVSKRHRIFRGVLVQGYEVLLEINEQGFTNSADLHLFGEVLHSFFTALASVSEFVQTRVVQVPSYKEYSWMPSVGKRSIF